MWRARPILLGVGQERCSSPPRCLSCPLGPHSTQSLPGRACPIAAPPRDSAHEGFSCPMMTVTARRMPTSPPCRMPTSTALPAMLTSTVLPHADITARRMPTSPPRMRRHRSRMPTSPPCGMPDADRPPDADVTARSHADANALPHADRRRLRMPTSPPGMPTSTALPHADVTALPHADVTALPHADVTTRRHADVDRPRMPDRHRPAACDVTTRHADVDRPACRRHAPRMTSSERGTRRRARKKPEGSPPLLWALGSRCPSEFPRK